MRMLVHIKIWFCDVVFLSYSLLINTPPLPPEADSGASSGLVLRRRCTGGAPEVRVHVFKMSVSHHTCRKNCFPEPRPCEAQIASHCACSHVHRHASMKEMRISPRTVHKNVIPEPSHVQPKFHHTVRVRMCTLRGMLKAGRLEQALQRGLG
jgi:hypothetical protein